MPISDFEERPARMDRKIESCSRNQFFVVHVPGMDARRRAVNSPVSLRRGNSHAPEKWVQRNFNSGTELGNHAFTIERNDLYAGIGKIFRQEAGAEAEA